MKTIDVLANIYCSEEFTRDVAENQVICLSVINILLGITAIVENTLILIALYKGTSLYLPSKVLLRNLVASDLCVGFVQLASVACGISIVQGRWQICRLLFFVQIIGASILIAESLWAITAISVDRFRLFYWDSGTEKW